MSAVCLVAGCEADPQGSYVCPRHWSMATADEVAAVKMAYFSPLYPRSERVNGDVGRPLQEVEYVLAVTAAAAAIGDREPTWRKEKRRA